MRGVHCISSTSAAGAVTQETSSSLQARPGAKGEVLHPLESTSPSQRIAHPHLQLQVSSDTGSLVPSCNTWGNLLSKTHPDPWSQKTWCWMPSCFLLHLLGWYLLEKANPGAQPLDIAHAVYLPPLGIPRHYEGKRWRHYMNTYLLKQGPRASLKYQTKSFPIHLQNQ